MTSECALYTTGCQHPKACDWLGRCQTTTLDSRVVNKLVEIQRDDLVLNDLGAGKLPARPDDLVELLHEWRTAIVRDSPAQDLVVLRSGHRRESWWCKVRRWVSGRAGVSLKVWFLSGMHGRGRHGGKQ